ncbi:hypothetical protein GCM10010149_91680 [Nonomuraea roseoviolacea subsp. roseoviolacea]|uniref:hypothetical protein n=1 Tax=Nonomuraea roseoviolacea TaxID=103837 RepID=UPI0031DBF834
MARWFGLWHGGSGYSLAEDHDLEQFSSLEDAKRKLTERHRRGYRQRSRFDFVHREPAEVLTPCVGDDCEITLYRSRDGGGWPDARVYLGPRGGVRFERL